MSSYTACPKCGKWGARLNIKGKYIGAGASFATAEEAAHAYDEMAKKHQGEFAYLNFPINTHCHSQSEA